MKGSKLPSDQSNERNFEPMKKATKQDAKDAIEQLLEAAVKVSEHPGIGPHHRSNVLLMHAELAEKFYNEGDYDKAVTILTHPERIVLC